jgi:Dolichyl-phosphate-mannose-protein mannosyltransferase
VAVAERDLTPGLAGRAAQLFPWSGVVAPWLVSRVLSVVVLLAAVNDPARGSRFVQVATRWDGAFYLDVARNGYGPVDVPFPKWPFFPLLPGVIRALSEVADDKAAIFVVNQVLFLVALAGVYRLASRRGGPTVAALAVWALALFPASFVFSMTYPSAIFLAASVWAFVLVEDHHDLAAGLVAVGAALVRPNGVVLVIALVVAVRTWRRAVLVTGPAVAAVVAWCIWCWDRTGDPFVFLTTKSRWDEITFVGLFEGHVKWSVLPHVLLAAFAIGVLVVQRKRLPVSWLVFGALYLIPSLQLGMVGVGRYANECFPPFVGIGQLLERWSTRVRAVYFVASTVGLVLFAFVAARYDLVP